MAEGSKITNDIKSMIGLWSEPVVLEVEKGAIARYADAIDDDNPLYRNEEYAKSSRYGGIIAPPGFFGWPVGGGNIEAGMARIVGAVASAGMPRILDGGIEYNLYAPVRAGDILVTYGKLADAREKETKSQGTMVFLIIEQKYLNQNGVLVALARQTLICS
jgi:acyl dehydratase